METESKNVKKLEKEKNNVETERAELRTEVNYLNNTNTQYQKCMKILHLVA